MDTTRFRERWPNRTPTSLVTCTSNFGRCLIDTQNGEAKNGEAEEEGKVELRDILVIETTEGKKLEFEVVGLVEDDEQNGFAVAYSEQADEFVVTDEAGKLLENDDLAQEILDDFFELAEESEPTDHAQAEGSARKGN